MTTYIGTATSRVDGRAKVTGAAKYAGEYHAKRLVHGSVVTSVIASGRIVRIDARDALRVDGVLDVLTHEDRPRIASRALSQHAWHPRTASLPLVRLLRCRRLPDRHRAARSHNPMADPSTTTPVVVVRGY